MSDCTVYIDESGDLGVGRGTKWFVLSGVIVDKDDERDIRDNLSAIKTRLNVREIHLKNIQDFYRRAYIVQQINSEKFTYINIIADTSKFDITKIPSTLIAYNYMCRMLLERVSWFLRDTGRTADVILSARGTSRDGELIDYIQNKLIPYSQNEIVSSVFERIRALQASQWDLLQLADICATTTFLAYEKNGWGFCTPCYASALKGHLYAHNEKLDGYGLKYFSTSMKADVEGLKKFRVCTKKERTPGATTT